MLAIFTHRALTARVPRVFLPLAQRRLSVGVSDKLSAQTIAPTRHNGQRLRDTSTRIKTLREQGDIEGALTVFQKLLKDSVTPDKFVLKALLAAMRQSPQTARKHQPLLKQIAANLDAWRIKMDTALGFMLTDALWKSGADDQALGLFERLQREGLADLFTCNITIIGLARAGKIDEAVKILENGSKRGLRWDSYSFSALLVACGKQSDLAAGMRAHELALKHNAATGAAYCNSLLDMYARCGELEQARAVLEDMKRQGLAGVDSYTAMANGLARAGKIKAAEHLLDEGSKLGLRWDSRTFTALLSACGEAGDLAAGLRFHKLAIEHNAAHGSFYSNALLDLYASCGEIAQAKSVFDELKRTKQANLVSYNAMIAGLARAGQVEDSESLLREGADGKMRWNSRTFTALLAACGKQGDLASGKRVHEVAKAHDAAHGDEYTTALIDMYARCGELDLARQTLDATQIACAASYNAMLSGLASAGKIEEAEQLLGEGTKRGLRWNSRTFSALLVACGEANNVAAGNRFHELAQTHNAAHGSHYRTSLLDMYANCGELALARAVFVALKRASEANMVSYTAMIVGLARNDCVDEAMQLLDEGLERGLRFNERVFSPLLAACGKRENLKSGQRVHEAAVSCGAALGRHYLTSLLDLYARCGELEQARAVFDGLQQRNMADAAAYSAFVSGLARNDKIEEGLELLDDGNKRGLRWDSHSFGALLVACGKRGDLATGVRVHEMAQQHNAANGAAYCNSLLNMYACCGQMEQARAVLEDLKRQGLVGVITYTTLIDGTQWQSNIRNSAVFAGYCSQRRMDDAFAAFAEMQTVCASSVLWF